MAAKTSTPPPTITAAAIVSSRRPRPVVRAFAAVVADAVVVDDAAGDDGAGVTETAGETADADAGGDVTTGVAVGKDNGRSAGDSGDVADTWWCCAHFSHPSQTEADSGISRPHDAQRFTRVAPAPAHTAGTEEAASLVPSETA